MARYEPDRDRSRVAGLQTMTWPEVALILGMLAFVYLMWKARP